MASPVNAVFCALIATGFWALLGYALARHVLPRVLAIGFACVLGWAVHSAVMLPVYGWIGFSQIAVITSGAFFILVAGASLSLRGAADNAEPALAIPPWAFAVAVLIALIPAAAILPKFSGDGVWLADPIFDHAKSAVIDAIARLGLPPVNPVFGEVGGPTHLAYYYLWHFSAAEIALALSLSGWEADIGLTWFTAFASLCLMMGLAVWLAKRSIAAIGVRGACRRRFAVDDAVLDFRHRRSRAGAVAADRNGRLAVSVHLGAPASDGGFMRGHGDAADCARCRAAAPGADSDSGAGDYRRVRKLDLCRRRHLRDCRRGRNAVFDPRDRTEASRELFGRTSDCRSARRLPVRAVRRRAIGGGPRSRWRQPHCRRPLHGVRRAVSVVAAPPDRPSRLLAHHSADRVAGEFCRRRHRARRVVAQPRPRRGKSSR